MYGHFQQMYIDMVDGKANQNVVELLGKLDELYFATSDVMDHIVVVGSIDPTNRKYERIMKALFKLDHGQVLKGDN